MFDMRSSVRLLLLLFALLLPCLATERAGAAGMGGMGGGGGCCGGGGSTVTNPPVSGPFVDPPEMGNLSHEAGVVEVDVEAKLATVNVNGSPAELMTYNGSYPAPTIRVKQGDKLKIHLKNSLPATSEKNMLGYLKNITNLHTHGFHVHSNPPAPGSTDPLSDYLMYQIGPNEKKEHEYDLSYQPAGMMSFYHPHKHGLTAEQYWGGMLGTILVEDPTPLLAPYETHQVILKDISISGGAPAPYTMMNDYMMGKEGNILMVNGRVNPQLLIKPGQVQRWRILNASNARFYKLSLESHSMYVIGTDGGLLDKPYPVSSILLSPGERVDVLVKAATTQKDYRLLSIPYSRMGMGGMGGSQTITLMTMTCKGTASPQPLPAAINSKAVRLDPNKLKITARRTLVLSMGMGRGYINGQDFDVDPYMIMSARGTYEIWTINNASNMDHPFHQHINAAQVLSISGGDSGYYALYTKAPAWKDVVIVPKMGSVTILVPVMDHTGDTMFHCHILEHEDIGMMGMWDIMDMPMPGGGGGM